jgi:ribosomal protein S18 acetylase RimI-like enzyme
MPHHIGAPRTDLEGLDDLGPLWMELHRHHRDVSDYENLVEDLGASWERRLNWYRRILAEGGSYLTAVDEAGHPVGYAMVAIESGPDDTFETARGIAEVVTLVVAGDQRSAGIGRALLRAAEGIARDSGFDTMKIAVMSGNARARAFYETYGYSVAEHVLYRHLSDDQGIC